MTREKSEALLKWVDNYFRRVRNDFVKADVAKMIQEKKEMVSMIKSVLDEGKFDYNNLVIAMVMIVMMDKTVDQNKLMEIGDSMTVHPISVSSIPKNPQLERGPMIRHDIASRRLPDSSRRMTQSSRGKRQVMDEDGELEDDT